MRTKVSLIIDVLLLVLLAAFLVVGSRPARQADINSANNNRMLHILIDDCKRRGGCFEMNP
jgi:hypothetical protein